MATAANENASSLVWSTFLDLTNDVKPWLQFPVTNTSQDPQIQLVTDMACQWVQNYLGRPIGRTQFDRRFDGWSGWNGAYLELPYYPVLQIISVTEYWGVSGPHVLDESTPANQVDGWQCEYPTGRLIRVFPGNVQKPWFPGSRNVEVSWEAGYNPLPADIKMATLEMAAYWWRNTQQASREAMRPMEYDPEETARGLFPGVPDRIIELLDPYIQVGVG